MTPFNTLLRLNYQNLNFMYFRMFMFFISIFGG